MTKLLHFQITMRLKLSSLMLGWMNDLRFYVLSNNISVISGRWAGDNEKLTAKEPCLQLKTSVRKGMNISRPVLNPVSYQGFPIKLRLEGLPDVSHFISGLAMNRLKCYPSLYIVCKFNYFLFWHFLS